MIKAMFARSMYTSLVLGHKFEFIRPVIQWANKRIASMIYKSYEKHGEEGLEAFWVPAMKEFGRIRAPFIAKTMNVDPDNAGSIGQYHDLEDPIFGVTGHWEKNEEGLDVRVETECDICEHLEKISGGKNCPAFCRKVITAMELGTGQAINPNYTIEIDTLLTEGDKDCRFIHKIQ